MAKKRRKKQNTAPPQPRPRLEGMDRLTGHPSGTPAPRPRPEEQRPAAGQQRPAQTDRPAGAAAPGTARRKRRRGLFGRAKKEPARRSRGERLRAIATRKKRAERRFLIQAAALYLACAIVAGASFFPIARVEVRGLTHYPLADVLATFGVEPGENMFFCPSMWGARKLAKEYPYFEKVRITRTMPDTLVINVTETETVAAVGSAEGGYYLVDENARVLESVTASGETPRVAGMSVKEAEIGKNLSSGADGRVNTLKTLLTALKDAGLLDTITGYCMVDLSDIYICYEGRVAVRLGTIESLEQKLHDMDELLTNNLSPSDVKKLDLTGLPVIRLIPSTQDEVDRIMQGEFSRASDTLPADGTGADS